MKLLDYIRGLRKGKEAHRLEKESMKDPFLADAMDGYHQVEGDHDEQINKLRMKVNAHSAKEKKYVCRHLEHCRLPDYRNRNQQLLPVSETERWRGCVYS